MSDISSVKLFKFCIAGAVKAANLKPILTKKIVADTACLFIEAARHDLDEENLKNFLCQICSDEQRIKKLCERYVNNKATIQCQLESIGNTPPHIVDVDWHLDYCVKVIDRRTGYRSFHSQMLYSFVLTKIFFLVGHMQFPGCSSVSCTI